MSEKLPFFLSEAQVTLQVADAAGNAAGGALWFGGLVNQLHSAFAFEEVLLRASGARYQTAHHVEEEHTLNFGQSWLVQLPGATDWKPGRNQQYVLTLLWTSQNKWLRRVYSGVTWRTLAMESQSTNHFLTDQTLRAQTYADSSGTLAPGGSLPPVIPAPAPGFVQPVAFSRENTLIVGEYLLGFYAWGAAVTLLSAKVISNAPQGVPMVLGLELNGTLTGQTLSIPSGTVNTEVTASVTLTGVVAAGQYVRWKILSGPASPADGAYDCAVVMEVSA